MTFGFMFERDAADSMVTRNSRDARNIRNSHNNIDASNSPETTAVTPARATTLATAGRHQQQVCKHQQVHTQQQGLERASINKTAALETTATEEGQQQQGFHPA